MKTCNRCKTMKHEDQFYKSRTSKDGVTSGCRECMKAYASAYKKGVRDGGRGSTTKRENLYAVRVCRACKMEKTLRSFFKCKSASGGYRYTCKQCLKVAQRKDVHSLSDKYIKSLLAARTSLSWEDIPAPMIEAKRLEILIAREARQNGKYKQIKG